jgi:PAS domain S-box-containing protein
MKLNLPNTDVEIRVPADEILVSRTDTRGILTYVNSSLAEVSGYAVEELLGASHNIVRHSDVPPAVFEDLWRTLKAGRPWLGVMKNRSKSGKYYWVKALIAPTYCRGEVVGYVSVRRRPSDDEIAAAQGQFARAASGAPQRPGWRKPFARRFATVRNGIVLGLSVVFIIFMTGAVYTIRSIEESAQETRNLYQQQVDGADSLRQIKFLMGENRAQVMQALLHAPKSPVRAHLDHAVESHFVAVAENRDAIEKLWARFKTLKLDAATAPLAERYWQARQTYVAAGLGPAMEAVVGRADFDGAHAILVGSLAGSYAAANAQVDALIDHLQRTAYQRQQELERINAGRVNAMIIGILAASTFLALMGWLFFRGIMRPLGLCIGSLKRMAQGDLSRHPDIEGTGEIGELMEALAISQTQLHAILDQVAQNATTLSGQSSRLNRLVRSISNGTDEQYERVDLVKDKMARTAGALAEISQQAAVLTERAASAETALDVAKRDVEDMMARIRALLEGVAKLQGREGGQVFAGALPDTVARVDACLDQLSEHMEQEEPALLGLSALSTSGWQALKQTSLELEGLARELAISTRIQSFAADDMYRDMQVIADFLVTNRGDSHEIWAASNSLLELASSLETLTGLFTFDGQACSLLHAVRGQAAAVRPAA